AEAVPADGAGTEPGIRDRRRPHPARLHAGTAARRRDRVPPSESRAGHACGAADDGQPPGLGLGIYGGRTAAVLRARVGPRQRVAWHRWTSRRPSCPSRRSRASRLSSADARVARGAAALFRRARELVSRIGGNAWTPYGGAAPGTLGNAWRGVRTRTARRERAEHAGPRHANPCAG